MGRSIGTMFGALDRKLGPRRRQRAVRGAFLICAAVTLTCASAAFGQTQDPRVVQARKDCLTGQVESGVALLAEVFVETKNANLVYNQARCYEQNGRAVEAINRFREYLRIAKALTAEERAEVDKHIADCRAMKAEQKDAPAPAPDQPSAPPDRAAATGSAPPLPGPPRVSATAEPRQPAGGARLRLAGVVIGGVGVATLVTGGIFSYLVSSAKQEAEDNADKKLYDAGLDSRGHTYETLQWVCYGTGAALVATGVVFYAIGARRRGEARTVSLVPAIAPHQGGVLLQGRF